MKLSLNTDFTSLPRAGSVQVFADVPSGAPEPFDAAILPHDERHLRRRVIELESGVKILVDLPEPVMLATGDRLLLDGGRVVAIVAASEELYAIRPRDTLHLAELAWHIGNRHLAAAIERDRTLILRDHVIKAMLEGLGATVTDVIEPFEPVRGAYSGHGGHDHGQNARDSFGRAPGDPHFGHNHGPSDDQGHHPDGHDHEDHGARDRFGRLPSDPHYGHNHG